MRAQGEVGVCVSVGDKIYPKKIDGMIFQLHYTWADFPNAVIEIVDKVGRVVSVTEDGRGDKRGCKLAPQGHYLRQYTRFPLQ